MMRLSLDSFSSISLSRLCHSRLPGSGRALSGLQSLGWSPPGRQARDVFPRSSGWVSPGLLAPIGSSPWPPGSLVVLLQPLVLVCSFSSSQDSGWISPGLQALVRTFFILRAPSGAVCTSRSSGRIFSGFQPRSRPPPSSRSLTGSPWAPRPLAGFPLASRTPFQVPGCNRGQPHNSNPNTISTNFPWSPFAGRAGFL